jgi:hypothetical protein
MRDVDFLQDELLPMKPSEKRITGDDNRKIAFQIGKKTEKPVS